MEAAKQRPSRTPLPRFVSGSLALRDTILEQASFHLPPSMVTTPSHLVGPDLLETLRFIGAPSSSAMISSKASCAPFGHRKGIRITEQEVEFRSMMCGP